MGIFELINSKKRICQLWVWTLKQGADFQRFTCFVHFKRLFAIHRSYTMLYRLQKMELISNIWWQCFIMERYRCVALSLHFTSFFLWRITITMLVFFINMLWAVLRGLHYARMIRNVWWQFFIMKVNRCAIFDHSFD